MLLLAGLAGLFLLESPWNVIALCAAAVIEVGEVAFWISYQRRHRVSTGAEGMLGQAGEVVAAGPGSGLRVRVAGEIWNATSSAALEPGSRVRIRGVRGLALEVEPVEPTPGSEKGP